ncbi:MAG: hypothetical protein QOJ99_2053 [Bryobacterales bacterium]|nr:hypothetical protein [Bryobacterales bacterium]
MDKGAHFHHCELQTHTPRDIDWKGKDCVTHEERKAYAESLVKACRDKGLNAIAITDHHDMLFVPYVRRAAAAETDSEGKPLTPADRLTVFPGMELTLGVPCQAILILDADFPENLFAAVLTALTLTPSNDASAKTAQVIRLDAIQSFKMLKQKLDEHDWLRDRYIIFPNVSGEGKHSLLRNGQAGKYTEMAQVGGYVDGAFGALKEGPKNILAGKDKQWGNKRLACLQTSDNRREDHGQLAQHTTWVKWAVPTAEALRQACLAQESRISHDEPQLPSTVVESISVSNSAFLGPVDLAFNPQYNALIGGRGTGKSTILEYLRWALCDQPPLASDEETPNYQMRRSRLIENTLKPFGATIDVNFIINDVRHVIRRDSKDASLTIKIGQDEMRPCGEAEVRTLLPIQAYSQKQLSDVSVRIDELARFITAPIRSDLNQIESRLAERAARLRSTYATRRRQQVLTTEIAKRELESKSLQEQADALRKSLSGLSADDRALLNKGKTFEAADQAVDDWISNVNHIAENARTLQSTIADNSKQAATIPKDVEPEILAAALEDYRSLAKEAVSALNKLARRAELITAASDTIKGTSPWSQWRKKYSEFRDAYEAAIQRSSAHKEKMEQLQSIEKTLATRQKETARLNDELKSLKTAADAYAAERTAWHAARAERDALLDTQCQALTTSSNGAIRAQLRKLADAGEFTEKLREALSGSGIRRDRFDALATVIVSAENSQSLWTAIVDELEALATFVPQDEGVERRPNTPNLSAAGFAPGDLDRIARKLSAEEWLSLSLIEIKSEPVFEYRSRENEYIPFRNASSGQQATALLKTLLNQQGPPLLVDQPEEDLDNPVMQEIVEQLWQAKRKRQLVFVSHNANLVVNGDAELVAWCDYRKAGDQSGGKIAGEGAIDMPDAREAIKRIMEGGEAAFKLRREKYGF